MNALSKEKLNFQKSKKNLTNAKISQLTGIPISNVDKIFSGANKNPTLDTLQKIANILDCSIDDFIEYDIPPVSPVYINKKTKEIAEALQKNKLLEEIFENALYLKEEDLEFILKFIKRLRS